MKGNFMRKNIISFVFFSLLLNAEVYSQPYYYKAFNRLAYDQYGSEYTYSTIGRINLNNPANVDTIFRDFEGVSAVLGDETDSWIIFDSYHFLILKNLNTITEQDTISFNDQGVLRFSYLSSLNKFFVYHFDGNTFKSMITLNRDNLSIRDTIPDNVYSRSSDFTLSKGGGYLYLNTSDSLSDIEQVWKYSLSTHQITNKKNINDIVLSGSEKSYLYFRQNGLALVESYYSMNDPFDYFKIYFLDIDSLSIPIKVRGPAEAYIACEGKYLLLFATLLTPDSLNLNPIGKIDIYDMTDGVMKKTIQLPPDGQVLCFENYPNNIYYVKDIELPTRQVWNLKIDSIFNELDLSSLTPSTVNVNTPAFSLTVKGKGFDTLSTVYFNGQPKTTTFISDSALTTEILASDVSVAGTFPVWVKDEWAVSDTLQFIVQASSPNLLVTLKSSTGTLLTTGALQYYEGSWKDAVSNGDGTFTVITSQNNVSLRMTYEYAQQTVNNIPAHNNTYTFQTVSAIVQLKNSLGLLIDTGTVQYYAGAWRSFGTTTNGVITKELLPINYGFRITYAYASIDKQQNLSVDPTVVFQTVNASVQLKNSLGNFQDVGTVQYYAGAWRSFGTTTNGVATKELLPINYSFRMTYAYASIDKQQNLSVDPIVVFQTVNAQVQLKNSLGNFQDIGTVQYYAGAWRSFGTTTNGVATKELLPINYSFRMTHAFLSKDKQQNLSTNPVVDFQTVLCTVKVTNSTNQPLNNAAVKYYAGAWRDFGATNASGITAKELLPQNISFRASYGSNSQDKQQDIATNNLVEIQIAP
jgi:hypothetical protein